MLTATENHHICSNNEATTAVCIEPVCRSSPSRPSLTLEAVEDIRLPVYRVGEHRLKNIRRHFIAEEEEEEEKKKYTFLMAVSSNHFSESQGAIKGLHEHVFPYISNYSFIVYDLGLGYEELALLKKYGRAEIRRFPFSSFPWTEYLTCYTWKPLIIMAHIEQAEILVWVDASVRIHRDIRPLFTKAAATGIVVREDVHQFSQHISQSVFDYFNLGERHCQFSAYHEIEAGFVIYHNEPFIRHLILEPWVACALDPLCMCTNANYYMYRCYNVRMYGQCHRFDQAVLGYILIKLFRHQRDSVLIKTGDELYSIRGGELSSYFHHLQTSQD